MVQDLVFRLLQRSDGLAMEIDLDDGVLAEFDLIGGIFHGRGLMLFGSIAAGVKRGLIEIFETDVVVLGC